MGTKRDKAMARNTEPRFIIQSADGTTYYLTVQVWTYQAAVDGTVPNNSPPRAANQLRNDVEGKFNQLAQPANLLKAVLVPVGDAVTYDAMMT
jgi:hypothetical protein